MTVNFDARLRAAQLARGSVRLLATSPWIRYLTVTFVFGIVAVIMTWPHARLFSTTILGDGGDVPAGIRSLWALDEQGGNPFSTARDVLLAAPEGVPVLRAVNVANFLFVGTIWLLGQGVGFVAAFNAYSLAALILSATTAFILLDRLRFGVLAAAFGAYVFGFNPNHIDKVFGHAPLAATGILPLVLLALLARRTSPTILRACAAGALLGVAFYLNSYLGLFAFFLAATFTVVDVLLPAEATSRGETLRSYYFVALTFVLGLIPLGVSWYFDPSSVSSLADERSEVFQGGSAVAQLYLLPGPRHPLLGGPMSAWLETNLSWEYTMFFGYTTIALAVAGVVLAFVRSRRKALTRERQFVVVFAVAVTVVGVWASLPPWVHVGALTLLFLLCTAVAVLTVMFAVPAVWRHRPRQGALLLTGLVSAWAISVVVLLLAPTFGGGFEVPTPSFFIREATTLYRVFSRFGVLAGLGLVILAAYTLSSIPWRRYRVAVPIVALVVVGFELYVGPSKVVSLQDIDTPVTVRELARSASSRPIIMKTSETPSYVEWLKSQPEGIVVDYPNPHAPNGRWAWKDVFYQRIHRHPLWQAPAETGGTVAALQKFAVDLTQPSAASALRVAAVKYIVVHRDRYSALRMPQPQTRCGLVLLETFPAERVAVYGITAAARRGFAIRGRGFHDIRNVKVWPENRGFQWMPATSEVLLYSPRSEEVFLSGFAVGLDGPRELDVYDAAGRQVGAWEIRQFESAFRFALHAREGFNRFTLRSKPGAERSEDDNRLRAIAVSSLLVTAVRSAAGSAMSEPGVEMCEQ